LGRRPLRRSPSAAATPPSLTLPPFRCRRAHAARDPTLQFCADPRVDPATVLGLGLGDALIIRNLGGRFTPDTLQTMAALGTIARAEGASPGPGWNLVVLHHTDCGITRLGEHAGLLAGVFGIDPADLHSKAVGDPVAAVAADVAAIKANPFLPASFLVSGLVYDVATGLIDVVVPPAPLRPEESAA
jgi:carbonic anhydrase